MKTKRIVLIIIGTVLLTLAMPFILFFGILAASIIGDEMITQKDVEKYGKEMQPKSGIVFPSDTTFVNGHWVKYCIFQERDAGWCYTSKEPFQFPENVEVEIKEDDLDLYEDWFGRCFETNITDATEYKEAKWMTNGFVFKARILKTPEQYYLNLGSRFPYPEEREDLKAKEVADQ